MKLDTAFQLYLEHLEDRDLSERHLESVIVRLKHFIYPTRNCSIDRKDLDVTEISRADLRLHIRGLEELGRAEATLAGNTASLKAFFNWLLEEGYIHENPGRGLKKYSYRPVSRRAAPLEHLRIVVNKLPEFIEHRDRNPRDVRDALFVSLIIDSAARLGEVRSIRRQALVSALYNGQMTRSGRMVYPLAGYGKTGGASLRFYSETASIARFWLEILETTPWSKAEHVFISLIDGKLMKRASLGRAFVRICKFAGVPPFRSHAVRKRLVTSAITETGDWKVGQMVAGHSTPTVTMVHYNDVQTDRVDEVLAKLADDLRGMSYDAEINEFFGIDPKA